MDTPVCFPHFLAEVSVAEHQRGDEGPEVDAQAKPTGADLHPHGWHGALHGIIVCVRPGEEFI